MTIELPFEELSMGYGYTNYELEKYVYSLKKGKKKNGNAK